MTMKYSKTRLESGCLLVAGNGGCKAMVGNSNKSCKQ